MTSQETLVEIRRRLLEKIEPERIILFGSIVRGNSSPDSDIDLLIIWDGDKQLSNIERRIKLRDIIGRIDYPLDILTCSTIELERALTNPNSFTAQIVKEGEIIYTRLK